MNCEQPRNARPSPTPHLPLPLENSNYDKKRHNPPYPVNIRPINLNHPFVIID